MENIVFLAPGPYLTAYGGSIVVKLQFFGTYNLEGTLYILASGRSAHVGYNMVTLSKGPWSHAQTRSMELERRRQDVFQQHALTVTFKGLACGHFVSLKRTTCTS